MNRSRIRQLVGIGLISAALGFATSSSTQDMVKLRLAGRYYAEPATVHISVSVLPDNNNRVLRIEADGETFFRSADVPLDGASAPKFHAIAFKNVPAGEYVVRAQLMSEGDVRAVAQDQLTVISSH